MPIELWHVAAAVMSTAVLVFCSALWLLTQGYRETKTELSRQAEASLSMFLIFMPLRYFALAVAALTLLVGLTAYLVGQDWRWAAASVAMCLLSFPSLRTYAHRKRTEKIEQQLPEALRLLANSMLAGLSLSPALALTAQQLQPPLATELKLISQRQRTGESLATALEDFHRRTATSIVQFFSLTLVTSMTYGGQQAEVLLRMAAAIQQQHYAKQRIRSLSAQARLQGRVMFVLPFALFWAIRNVHEASINSLLTTSSGQFILLICGCLMGTGFFLTRRILGQFYANN